MAHVRKLLTKPQREAIAAAVQRALEPLAVDVPQLFPDWADQHFYLSAESSGVLGRWETQAPQRGVMLVLANDDVREVSIKKCARIGYTKMLIALHGYYTAHRPRNGVIYQPTDGDSDDFVTSEVEPMIRDVDVVRDRMRGDAEKRGKLNNLGIKAFRGCIWHYRGGKAAAAYRRLTKDLVIYDELDGFDRDIEGTGDPVTLGDKRITASPFKKSIRGSTPEDRATSIIEATLATARLVFAWHFRCIHCCEFVEFKWAHLHWDDRDAEPYAACEKCGGIWTYRDLRDLNAEGHWQTVDGEWIDNADGTLRDAGGMALDWPMHVGFTMWSGWSPFITWRELRDEFLSARGNALKLKGFTNTRLGECWEEGEAPDWEQLQRRRENYPEGVEWELGCITIGVDVQDDRFEWQVTGWSPGEVSRSIAYGRLYVRTDSPQAFDRLFATLNQEVSIGERKFIPAAICIDSGHRADDVYRMCRKNPRLWIPVKGSSDARAPYVQFPRKRGPRHRTYLTMLGVSNIKSLIYSRLLLSTGEGSYHWPLDEAHDAIYFQQLTAEEKRTRYVKGHPVVEWWKPAGVGNEVLDTNVYAYAGMRIAVDYLGAQLEPPPRPVEARKAAVPKAPQNDWLGRRSTGSWLRGR